MPRVTKKGPRPLVATEVTTEVATDVPPCALDDAPVGSKLVVVRQDGKNVPILTTPDGYREVPPDDVARTLPEGAKVRYVAMARFRAEQLNPVLDKPVLWADTARDAIARFNAHFHDARE